MDVCPENLIRLIGLGALVQDPAGLETVSARFGVGAAELRQYSRDELDSLGAVMAKDEATCIRCALCASRCPTHAITMQRFEFFRECVSAPLRNAKLLYRTVAS